MVRKTVIALLAVVSIGLSPTGASARGGFGGHGFGGGGWHGGGGWRGGGGWHGGGWRGPGFGPALAGGLIAGAVIGGLASSAYAWGPGYGYYDAYAPVYDRGCPEPGYGEYYNCGAYAVPGYGAPAYYGYPYGAW
jgi:hypothetical protein